MLTHAFHSGPNTTLRSSLRLVVASFLFLLISAAAAATPPAASYIRKGQAAGGDLSGTYPNPSVQNDSHTHGATTGGTGQTSAADDAVLVGNGSTYEQKVVPDCDNASTSKILYDQATNTWTCGTDQNSGGGGGGYSLEPSTVVIQAALGVQVTTNSNVGIYGGTITSSGLWNPTANRLTLRTIPISGSTFGEYWFRNDSTQYIGLMMKGSGSGYGQLLYDSVGDSWLFLEGLNASSLSASNMSATSTISGMLVLNSSVTLPNAAASTVLKLNASKLVTPGLIVNSDVTDSTLGISKLATEGTVAANGILTVGPAGTGIKTLQPLTTFYATPIQFGTPDFHISLATTAYSTAADATFGKMRFIGSGASTTNGGIYTFFASPGWNTTLDPRLDSFAVMGSSATDNEDQAYTLEIASITENGTITGAVFNDAFTVQIGTSTGSNAFNIHQASAPMTIGNWKDNIVPGRVHAIRVKRVSDNTTTDTSQIDSFMQGFSLRYATVAPGE